MTQTPSPLASSSPSGGCLRTCLFLSMAAAWLLLVLPALGTVASACWAILVLLGGAILEELKLTEDALATGILGGLLVCGAVAAVWGLAFLRGLARTTTATRWAGPGCLALALVATAMVAMCTVPMESEAQALFPDILTTLPILTFLLLLTGAVPILVLWMAWKSARLVWRVAAPRPFVAGIVAGACSMVAVPVGALGITASALDQESAQVVPSASFGAAGSGIEFQRAAEALQVLVEAAAEQERIEHDPVVACMDTLAQPTSGQSEVDKVRDVVKSQFSLSQEDAEDVTMAALISVCTHGNLDTYRNLGAVFMTAARNHARDLISCAAYSSSCVSADDYCSPYLPDETRLRSELMLVQKALQALDETTHRAIRLWAEGYTSREIATSMGITERQARDLVGNGTRKARKAVQDHCTAQPRPLYPAFPAGYGSDWDDD